jgi:hypothetical protein
MSTYQPYPAWRFHPKHPARIVNTAAEDQALGKGWVDSHLKLLEPDDPVEPAPPPAPAPVPAPVPEPEPHHKPTPRARRSK